MEKKKRTRQVRQAKEFEPRECDSAAAGCWILARRMQHKSRPRFSRCARQHCVSIQTRLLDIAVDAYESYGRGFRWLQKEKEKIGNDGPSSVYLYTQGSAGSVPWCRTWWVDGWVVLSLRENPQNPRETQSRAVSKWIDIHPDIAEWEEDFSFSFHFFVVGLLFFFCFPPPSPFREKNIITSRGAFI